MTDEMRKEVMCLTRRLLNDLKLLGISPSKLDYQLELKNFSKRYYGRYVRKQKYGECINKVFVYLFKSPDLRELNEYQDLLSTTVHEVCHHIQHNDPDFVRKKGVMHDKQFWNMYNDYMNLYFKLNKSTEKGERYLESVKKANRLNK